MEKILKAIPVDDFQIEIRFENGTVGLFDVKPYLKGTAFEELKNLSYFCLVKATKYGIAWPNEQDFSSDTIIYDLKSF